VSSDQHEACDFKIRKDRAKLLKRVFNLDLEHCPDGGSELKIIAAILERPAIAKILNHLGLVPRAPPRAHVETGYEKIGEIFG
jgi:hypothetical protein